MSIRFRILSATACCLAAWVLADGRPATAADPSETKAIKADDLTLNVPKAWREGKPSQFRKAQLTIPKVEGDKDDAEFVVFYFGGGGGGGVEANIQRWVKQFQPKDRKMKVTSGKSSQGDYVLVDQTGTWNKPVGRMQDGRTVEMPNARALSVILSTKEGNYFLRLTGPEKTVSANADAFRAAFGADAKTEKDRPLARE
jgi:gluconolactonase